MVPNRRISSSSSDDAKNENQSKTSRRIKKPQELRRNILSDLPPIPNSSGKISESANFQNSHDVVKARGSKKFTKSHIINENQYDIDEDAENVDNPYMIPSPVAMSETRNKKILSEISTLTKKAFDGMEVVDRNQEEYSRIIIQMLASIQVQLWELHQKIECGKPMFSGNVSLVASLLPLKSIAEIEVFEKIIYENPEIKEQFMLFYIHIRQ